MPKKKPVVVIAIVVLDEQGILEDVAPIRAAPDSTVVFVLVNGSPDVHTVAMDGFKVKANDDQKSPLSGKIRSHKLDGGDVAAFKAHLRPKADFDGGVVPYTTYKYTITVTNEVTGKATPYDPDLDVPPADS
jgi:hypothetical protein